MKNIDETKPNNHLFVGACSYDMAIGLLRNNLFPLIVFSKSLTHEPLPYYKKLNGKDWRIPNGLDFMVLGARISLSFNSATFNNKIVLIRKVSTTHMGVIFTYRVRNITKKLDFYMECANILKREFGVKPRRKKRAKEKLISSFADNTD